MTQCPRCRSMVDERVNSACPQCSQVLNVASAAPLSPAAPAGNVPSAPGLGAPPASVRTNTRVSLTGEILEDAPTPHVPANSPHAGSQTTRSAMPVPPSRTVPSAYSRRESQPDNSDKKALLINLSVLFILLALCGGGGYWKWMHRTEPKAQVTRYIHAVQWLDWGVVWDLSASPPGGKSRHEFVSNMNDKFDNNGVLNIVARKSMEKIPFEIGEPTITGSDATVPVTRGATILEASKPMQLKLTNYGGVWKIHPLSANPLDMIHDPAADKAFDGKMPSLTPGASGIPTVQ